MYCPLKELPKDLVGKADITHKRCVSQLHFDKTAESRSRRIRSQAQKLKGSENTHSIQKSTILITFPIPSSLVNRRLDSAFLNPIINK
jgi:hypothetical protein